MSLGKVLGTPVFIHPLLALLLAVAAAAGYLRETVIIIGSLLTHELAHLAVARGFNAVVDRVTLYPFGGVAQVPGLTAMDPPVAALMALAGPFNNLVLVLAGFWAGRWWNLDPGLLGLFLQVNSLLVVVNLMPGLPLDGGRVVQALLRLRHGDYRAARQLVWYGYGVAAALLLAGLLSWLLEVRQPNLFVLAAAVFLAARQEAGAGEHAFLRPVWQRRAEFSRRGLLPVKFLAVPATLALGELLPHLGSRHYYLVWVLDDDLRPRGMLAEGDLLAAALAGRYRDSLGDILDKGSSI